ncbi:40S ribosomal protein uS10 [Dipodascopsis tothii]|uniref:40S ribosomal protein uS10 n=1 Tax=Dipodascopsis tothii TaxID=44089 RepID=UPI0034CFA16A
MSAEKEKGVDVEAPKVRKFRITMTSKKVQQLEKFSNNLVTGARAQGMNVQGPVRLPTKTLRIATRKTPNGEGSKTWDSYEMRIHKRLVRLEAFSDDVKNIPSFNIEPDVNVEITVPE